MSDSKPFECNTCGGSGYSEVRFTFEGVAWKRDCPDCVGKIVETADGPVFVPSAAPRDRGGE